MDHDHPGAGPPDCQFLHPQRRYGRESRFTDGEPELPAGGATGGQSPNVTGRSDGLPVQGFNEGNVAAQQGPVVNPHTGGPASHLDNWLANGGSLHTFHQMQVAQGLRPQIDARATVSPHETMPMNTDIRAGWGWEPAADPNTGSQAKRAPGRWRKQAESAGCPASVRSRQHSKPPCVMHNNRSVSNNWWP